MPNCIDTATQALTADGVAEDVARRAAVVAYWAETGHMPAPDARTDVDLTSRASGGYSYYSKWHLNGGANTVSNR